TSSMGETVPRQALAGNGDNVSERTVDVQVNRLRRKIERDPANPLIVQTVRGVGYRLVAALYRRPITDFYYRIGRLRIAAGRVVTAANALAGAGGYITGPWDRFTRWLRSVMPHGLYARALLIVIMPLVVLQSIVVFLFIERQSSVVNYYLSSAATREIAALIDVYKNLPPGANRAQLLRHIAQDRLGLVVAFLQIGRAHV